MMAELLTKQNATEYRDRARLLPINGLQDIGDRRALRMELQARCNRYCRDCSENSRNRKNSARRSGRTEETSSYNDKPGSG